MFKIKKIINFFEIIFFSLICFITLILYNPSFINNLFSNSSNYNNPTNNYINSKQYINEYKNIDEIYVLKQQRKILIELLKDKNLDYMKNTFLKDINDIDEKLLNLNANMDDIDIIII